MSKQVDWLYHRKSCISCQRARTYLAAKKVTVADQADARTDRRGPKEALELAKTVEKIHVAKGKKVVTLDLVKDRPDDETLVKHLLGPSGNLRAPTLRKGKVLYVGFSEEAYAEFA